jgi:hypothetical protein
MTNPYVTHDIDIENLARVAGVEVALRMQNVVYVKKNPGTNEFSSIKTAIESILDATVANPHVVLVGPGIYVEQEMVIDTGIHVIGSSIGSVVVEPDTNDHHVFVIKDQTSINFISITNVGSGYAAIYAENNLIGPVIHKVSISDCGIGVFNKSTIIGSDSFLYIEYLDITDGEYGVVVQAENGFTAEVNAENFYVYGSAANPLKGVEVRGSGAIFRCVATAFDGVGNTGIAIDVDDGGELELKGIAVRGWDTAIRMENAGTSPTIAAVGVVVYNCNIDLLIDHPSATGSFGGSVDQSKVFISPTSSVGVVYADNSGDRVGSVTVGKMLQGDRHDRLMDMSTLTRETSTMGSVFGGNVSQVGPLDVRVTSGVGFLVDSVDDFVREVIWPQTDLILDQNKIYALYVNRLGLVQASETLPSFINDIILGRCVTHTSIDFLERSSMNASHIGNRLEEFQRQGIGPIFSSGSIITESTSGIRQLNVTNGVYFFGNTKYLPAGGNDIEFDAYYRVSGVFTEIDDVQTVDNDQWDNGSGLAPLASGYYAKHAFYLVGDGAEEKYKLVYSQAQYSALTIAEQSSIPIPPSYFEDALVLIGSLIVQQGVSGISEIRDERPVIGFKSSGVSAASLHGNLLGLNADDHKQYLLTSGSRPMAGSLNMGGNAITNVGDVDGVNVSAHAARHLPNSVTDPLTTAAPSANLSATTTNAVGLSNALARGDHSHAISTGVVSGQGPDQTSTAGSSANLARADHIHNIPTDVAAGQSPDQVNAKGSSTSFARADHVHSIATDVAASQTPDQTNAKGSSVSFARADHVHNIATASAVGLDSTSTSTQGSNASFARSNHTHAIASGAASGQTPDQASAAGSSSNFAKADHVHNIPTASAVGLDASSTSTQGSNASFARSNHTHAIASGAASTQAPDQSNAAGSSSNFARADHIHNIPTASAVSIGTANAQGSSVTNFARADHVHQGVHSIKANTGALRYGDTSIIQGSGTTVSDDGSGNFTVETVGGPNELRFTYPGTGLTVNYTAGKVRMYGLYVSVLAGSLLLSSGIAVGTIYVDIADGLVKASALGTAPDGCTPLYGYTTDGTSVTALFDLRVFINHNMILGVLADIAGLDATKSTAAGTLNKLARADHVHAIASGAVSTQTPDQANAVGSSSNFARADHIHQIATAAASGLNTTSTNTQGSSTSFSRADHTHAIASGAASTQNPDQANAAGSSANFAKADHVHQIPTAVAVSQTPDQTNAQGSSTSFSRADHVHNIATATASGLNANSTSTQGSASSFAKSDHTHAISSGVVSSQTPDQSNAAGTSANFARADHVHNIATASAVGLDANSTSTQGSNASFARSNHTHAIASGVVSSQTPDQTNAAGTSANFARADHTHNIATATPTNIGSANAQGSATTFARSDHVHRQRYQARGDRKTGAAQALGTTIATFTDILFETNDLNVGDTADNLITKPSNTQFQLALPGIYRAGYNMKTLSGNNNTGLRARAALAGTALEQSYDFGEARATAAESAGLRNTFLFQTSVNNEILIFQASPRETVACSIEPASTAWVELVRLT